MTNHEKILLFFDCEEYRKVLIITVSCVIYVFVKIIIVFTILH